jgi:F420 biosynthesis protein FbiB-like protein
VRKFLPRPIPDGIIKEILETAIWAPSAHNRQPWRFAVVQDQDARTRLAETMSQDFRRDLAADGCTPEAVETQVGRSYQRITNAPVAIVLCLDLSQGDPYPDPVRQQAEFLMGTQSVALAGGYLLLAVHAAGLAGVWMCAPLFAPASVRKSLELPEEWQPQALILIGYPAHEPKARTRKPLDEVVLFR